MYPKSLTLEVSNLEISIVLIPVPANIPFILVAEDVSIHVVSIVAILVLQLNMLEKSSTLEVSILRLGIADKEQVSNILDTLDALEPLNSVKILLGIVVIVPSGSFVAKYPVKSL